MHWSCGGWAPPLENATELLPNPGAHACPSGLQAKLVLLKTHTNKWSNLLSRFVRHKQIHATSQFRVHFRSLKFAYSSNWTTSITEMIWLIKRLVIYFKYVHFFDTQKTHLHTHMIVSNMLVAMTNELWTDFCLPENFLFFHFKTSRPIKL